MRFKWLPFFPDQKSFKKGESPCPSFASGVELPDNPVFLFFFKGHDPKSCVVLIIDAKFAIDSGASWASLANKWYLDSGFEMGYPFIWDYFGAVESNLKNEENKILVGTSSKLCLQTVCQRLGAHWKCV